LIWYFKGVEGSNRSLEEVSREAAEVQPRPEYPEIPSASAP
jgi:hypothetical protein